MQGDSLAATQNNTFRLNRYPASYAAFAGKDLSSKGWIETNPDSSFCGILLPVNYKANRYDLKLYPNPAEDMVTIEWQEGIYVTVEVFDLFGRRKDSMRLNGGRKYLNTRDWQNGVYFVVIDGTEVRKLVVQHR